MKLCSMQLECMWTCDHIRDPKMNHYGPSVCHKTGGVPCQLASPKAYCIPNKHNRVKLVFFFVPDKNITQNISAIKRCTSYSFCGQTPMLLYIFSMSFCMLKPRTNAFPDVGFTNPISCQAQEGWVNTTIYGLGKKKQDIW